MVPSTRRLLLAAYQPFASISAAPGLRSRLAGAFVALLITGTGLASGASAGTVTDSAGFGVGLDLVVDQGNQTGQKQTDSPILLNQFDPSLGTLTDVTFNLTSVLGSPITVAPLKLFVTGFGSTPIHSVGENVYTLSVIDPFTGLLLEKSFVNHAECQKSSGLCTVSDFEHNEEAYDDSVGVLPLAGYLGLGTYLVTIRQLTELSVVPQVLGGQGEALFNGRWRGNLEVVYTFSLVPEPSTAWLLGSGLIGLTGLAGFARRNQR